MKLAGMIVAAVVVVNLPPILDHFGWDILALLSLPPTLDHLGWEILASSGGELAGVARRPMKRRRHFVADRAVRANGVVVEPSGGERRAGMRQRDEQRLVEDFVAQAFVEALDEGVLRGPRPGAM